jgi:Putative peptidoglycan binding domain
MIARLAIRPDGVDAITARPRIQLFRRYRHERLELKLPLLVCFLPITGDGGDGMGSRFPLCGYARQFRTDLRTLSCRRIRGGPSLSERALALDRIAGLVFLTCVAGLAGWLANQTLPLGPVKIPVMTESAQAAPGAPDAALQQLGAEAAARPMTAAEIRKVQGRLETLGFSPGAIDGIAGRRTLDALNRYRASENLARASTFDRTTAADLLN